MRRLFEKKTREIRSRLTRDEVLERLAVPANHPVLEAVTAILLDMENEAVEGLRTATLPAGTQDVLRGHLDYAATAQERIAGFVREGNARKVRLARGAKG